METCGISPYAAIEGVEKFGISFDRKEGNDYYYTFYGESGRGFLRVREASPGVTIMYNEYCLSWCKSGFDAQDDLLVLDFCRKGRMNYVSKLGTGRYDAGDMCINSRSDHSGTYYFPFGHYVGVTVSFDLCFLRNNREALSAYPVDIQELHQKLLSHNERSIVRGDKFEEHLFSGFYDVPAGIRDDYYYHLVCELLLYLESLEPLKHAYLKPFIDRDNINKIVAIRDYLVKDVERHHTINDLAKRFDIPSTTLKTCFRAVYGDPVFSYMRTYRANKAAALLIRCPSLSIADIAVRVGYANPSKFSEAFKSIMGCLPSAYRKKHHVETGSLPD